MNLTGWANGAWADGSWVAESWGEPAPEPGMDLNCWEPGVWANGSWVPESWGTPQVVVPEVAATSVVGGGRRRRSYVELDGELVEVSGYEEAERLLSELKQEEKAQEKARKQLRISLGKAESGFEGALSYGQVQQKIEAIERQMDNRAERIALLYAMIQANLDAYDQDDDEEVLLLS